MTPSRLVEFLAKLEADVELALSLVKEGASGEDALDAIEVLEEVRAELAAAYTDAVHERTRYELEEADRLFDGLRKRCDG